MPPIGPYSQDVLTRIYNVHWGGGAEFVAGSLAPDIRYCKVEKPEDAKEWQNLGPQAFTSLGGIWGGSSAMVGGTPTFVLVGDEGVDRVENPDDEQMGIIMVSNDGVTWKKAHEYVNSGWAGNKEGTVLAVVWDENEGAFYAAAGGFMGNGGGTSPGLPVGTQWYEDVLLKSPDGKIWSQAGQQMIELADLTERTSFLLTPHCHTEVRDAIGQGVPDGVYGKHEMDSSTILIKPEKPPVVRYGDRVVLSPSPRVIVEKTIGGVKTTTTKDIGFPVNAVAHASEFWVAAGGVGGGALAEIMIAFSEDDGTTWTKVLSQKGSDYYATTAIGTART